VINNSNGEQIREQLQVVVLEMLELHIKILESKHSNRVIKYASLCCSALKRKIF